MTIDIQEQIDDICHALNQFQHEVHGELVVAKLIPSEDEWKIETRGAIAIELDEKNFPAFFYLDNLNIGPYETPIEAFRIFKDESSNYIEELKGNPTDNY